MQLSPFNLNIHGYNIDIFCVKGIEEGNWLRLWTVSHILLVCTVCPPQYPQVDFSFIKMQIKDWVGVLQLFKTTN